MSQQAYRRVRGTYDFRGETHSFDGEVIVNSELGITGEIRDRGSECPRHEILGTVEMVDGKTVISFLKNPTGEHVGRFTPIEYQFQKPGKDLEGSYEGAWRVAEAARSRAGSVGLAHDRTGEQRVVWIPETELENKATLNLYTD